MSFNLTSFNGDSLRKPFGDIEHASVGFQTLTMIPSNDETTINADLFDLQYIFDNQCRFDPFSGFTCYTRVTANIPSLTPGSLGDIEYWDTQGLVWTITETDLVNYMLANGALGIATDAEITTVHYHHVNTSVYIVACIDSAQSDTDPYILIIDRTSGNITKHYKLNPPPGAKIKGVALPESETTFRYVTAYTEIISMTEVNYCVDISNDTVTQITPATQSLARPLWPIFRQKDGDLTAALKIDEGFFSTLPMRVGRGNSEPEQYSWIANYIIDSNTDLLSYHPVMSGFMNTITDGIRSDISRDYLQRRHMVPLSYNHIATMRFPYVTGRVDIEDYLGSFILFKREDLAKQLSVTRIE